MKKFLALLLASIMVMGVFAGCASKDDPKKNDGKFDYDAIPDTMEAEQYEIAFITDVGDLKDKSFNQGTWEGVKRYASENKKSYKYYQPANGSSATDDDRYGAMKAAVDGGGKLVFAAGFMQEKALKKAAAEFPDVKFVFIDGWPLGLPNVAAIDFSEEQAGYLAGYAAVVEGYTKLGFSGGGGGGVPAVPRFGYGYVQGAEQAAKDLKIESIDMKYTYEYGANFQASADLQAMLNGWFVNGTQVIFMCGGAICQSGFAAAAANDGFIIGVDVDQSGMSDTVITSAEKKLREAVMQACGWFYNNEWEAHADKQNTLGAADNAIGLPMDTSKLEKFTQEKYDELYKKLQDGTLKVDKDYATGLKPENFKHVQLNIV